VNFSINKASIFMGASWVGLAGILLYGSAFILDGSEGVRMAGMRLLLIGSIALLVTRKADEYTLGLWNAAASVAFGAALVSLFGLGFALALIEVRVGKTASQGITADAVLLLQIAAFYIGLFVKRLLGDN
jgi:hypothetical protein